MLIKPFAEISKTDAAIAGGKGASLGEMTQAGIPVPPGFVVLATAFEQFLTETDLAAEIDTILHTVDTQAMHTVEHASERIQKLILEATMPKDIALDIQQHFKALGAEYVAVRSSATAEDSASAAWAGQLDSFLNTTEATLLTNVQRCWASLFTPRAIFYRFEQGLHASKISVAVVVQQMVASEVSGIAFSVHPVTEDRNQLIIEAGYGLGEAIVSGQITPDSYVVEKEPRRIIDRNIATQERGIFRAPTGGNEWKNIELSTQEQSKLSDDQILELSKSIIRIEEHYGFPCDIEWAYEGGKFFIVQSRPITTLKGSATQYETVTLSKVYSREKSLFYLDVWDKSDRLGIDRYIGESFERGSLFIAKPDGFCEVWYDSKKIAALSEIAVAKLGYGQKLVDDIAVALKEHWAALQKYFETSQGIKTITEARSYYDHLVGFWSAMNTVLFELAGNPAVPEHFSQVLFQIREKSQEYTNEMSEKFVAFFSQTYPQYAHLAQVISFREAEDLVKTHDTELLRRLEERLREGCFLFDQKVKPYPELTATLEQAKVTLTITQLVFQKTYERDFTLILEQSWLESFGDIRERYGLGGQHAPLISLFVTEENLQIWERAEGMKAFLGWLLEKNTSEPSFLAEVISEYKGILKQVEADWGQGSTADPDSFVVYSKLLRQGMGLFSLWYYSGVDERTPQHARDLAINCREGDDFFALNDAYIKAYLKECGVEASLANLVLLSELKCIPSNQLLEERRSGILAFDGEVNVHTTTLEEFAATHPEYLFVGIGKSQATVEEIYGQVAYRGSIQGKVRIVKNKSQLAQVGVGDIIVSPMTTPDFVPGMQKAAAFVTDEGGVMCHAAIVAREMKKPCIIGTKIATDVLRDGDIVEVDARPSSGAADNGVVRILNKREDGATPEQYFVSRSRKGQSPFPANWNGKSETDPHARQIHGAGVRVVGQYYASDGYYTAFYSLDEWNKVCQSIAERIVQDDQYVTRQYQVQKKQAGRASELVQALSKEKLDTLEIYQLLEWYTKIEDAWIAFDQENITPWYFGADKALELCKARLPDMDNAVSQTLFTSPTASFSQCEELALFEIAQEISDKGVDAVTLSPSIWKKIDRLVEQYYWIPFGYNGPETYDREHYHQAIQKILKEHTVPGITEKVETLRNYELSIREAQKSIIHQYHLSKADERLLEGMHTLARMTDERKEITFLLHVAFEKVLQALALKMGIAKEILNYVTLDEVRQGIAGSLDIVLLGQMRKTEGVLFLWQDGSSHILVGAEARDYAKKVIPDLNDQSIHSITGEVGSRGKKTLIRARVRVLLTSHNLEVLQPGEVLVAPMTTPEYVPAMRKSVAIITDEGGVTCHAAIVARELGIACIIGTKIATQVLKDGDLVEVDAEKGIIKVLNKE